MPIIPTRSAPAGTGLGARPSTFGTELEREEIRRLAAKERVLRDVAELIAHAGADDDILATIVREASRQIGDLPMTVTRFVGRNELLVMASHEGPAPVGTRIAFESDTLPDRVLRTGAPFRVDDYRNEPDAEMARRFGIVAGVAVPIIVEDGAWGMFTVTSATCVLPPDTETRLGGFAQLVTASFDSIEARTRLRAIAEHDETMRAIQQDAADAPIADALERLVDHAARLAGIERATVTLEGGQVESAANPMLSISTGSIRPHETVQFPVTAAQRQFGVLTIHTTLPALPVQTHQLLTDLSDVTGRIVLAFTNRQHLRDLVDEQASLRRIAELAARGVPLPQLFESVVGTALRLFGAARAALVSHEPGAPSSAVAIAVSAGAETQERGSGANDAGRRSGPRRVEVPITGERDPWGVLTVDWTSAAPDDAVDRLKPFADLTAIAIANAQNREAIERSRARMIAAGDDARRRLQRDVHDGAQQRLVHAILSLKLARDRARVGEPVLELIDEAIGNAEDANRQLRDVVRGVLPAALTRGGLAAGIEAFVADVVVPVQLHLAIPRLPAPLEITAYFVVAEAITNAVKHAGASVLTVSATIAQPADELVIVVADDGRGGADAARGSGLVGLMDRVEASYGELTIASPAGEGTTLTARLRVQPHRGSAGSGS